MAGLYGNLNYQHPISYKIVDCDDGSLGGELGRH